MWLGVVTLFPQMFHAVTDYGVVGRAVQRKIVTIEFWNPRDFTTDRHRTVDDRPYGGGPGMVLKVGPMQDAIRAARTAGGEGAKVICLSPQGALLDQGAVTQLAMRRKLVLVCGRYEGIDERLVQSEVDEEWSVGDYVVSGGELPAMTLIDSMTRCLPGALGGEGSAESDSFAQGLLDHPHYTRPPLAAGMEVPAVLLSGDHGTVRRWRLREALIRTWQRRPELLQRLALTDEQNELLTQIKRESGKQHD